MSTIQIWIAAIGTLCLYSFLYKENAAYRTVEHAFIGLSAAHTVIINIDNYIRPIWRDEIGAGKYSLILPFLIGLFVYARYLKSAGWLARIPISLTVGYGVGYTLATNPLPFLGQVTDTFVHFGGATVGQTINNILFFVLMILLMSSNWKVSRGMAGQLEYGKPFTWKEDLRWLFNRYFLLRILIKIRCLCVLYWIRQQKKNLEL